MALGKVSGIDWANLASVAGVAKANIAKVAGVDVPAAGGGAPEFRAASESYQSSGASTVTLNKPTGTVSGDLMVAIINFNTNGTITPPSGWTLKDSHNPFTGATIEIYYKVAGASEPSSYTWSFSTSTRVGAAMATFSGSYNADPQEGAYSKNTSSFQGTSVTTTNNNAMIVYLSAYDEPQGDTWGEPTGWTAAVSDSGGNNVYIGYFLLETAGSTGTVAYTSTNGSADPVAYLWAFITS